MGAVTLVMVGEGQTYDALVWHVEGVGVEYLSVNHLHQWCLVAVGVVTLVMVGEGETYDALVWHAVGVGVGDPSVGLEWAGLVGHMRTLRDPLHRSASTAPIWKGQGEAASLHTRERRVPLQQVTLCTYGTVYGNLRLAK